jgi:methyltransferase
MVTRVVFSTLVAAMALERLLELRKSRRNERRILALGGREHAPEQVPKMVALHASWLAGSWLEGSLCGKSAPPWLERVALAGFAGGRLLRKRAMRALGWRWNVRILTLPGVPLVTSGPYRRLRHPNYLGVALEIAALPLLRRAYVSALLFSVLNGLLLRARIREEQAALARARAR